MSRRSGQSGSIQKEGHWYVIRYWKDVAGQEKRQRVYERICPVSGPGKLSASERERKAKEIIAASGADTEEHFAKVVQGIHGVTFREQAAIWLDKMRNRKRKPVTQGTLENWESALDKWLNPSLCDFPLESVNNGAMKNVVAKMDKGGLAPKSIANYAGIVKMVVASAVDEEGNELYPRKWNADFIDMPEVKDQRQPSFTGEVVTSILANTKKDRNRVLFALCAATGLRIGEALGIDIKNLSPDYSTIRIVQKVSDCQVQDFLKTKSGKREVDLHPSVAAMLREYIGEEVSRRANSKREAVRKSGLLFLSRNGTPLDDWTLARRNLHPVLVKLGQPKCGFHAFRRFRNTYLRNFTATPPGLIKFWMGHAAAKDMSELYDKIKVDVAFRKEVAEKAGLGFKLPTKLVVGRNGRKIENSPAFVIVANA